MDMIKYVDNKIHLICDLCGYTQVVKKSRLDKHSLYEFEHCYKLYCDCNACKEQNPRTTPDGFYSHQIYPLQWTTILDPIVTGYLQSKRYICCGGWWSGMVNPSIEYHQNVKKAQEILKEGLKQKDIAQTLKNDNVIPLKR